MNPNAAGDATSTPAPLGRLSAAIVLANNGPFISAQEAVQLLQNTERLHPSSLAASSSIGAASSLLASSLGGVTTTEVATDSGATSQASSATIIPTASSRRSSSVAVATGAEEDEEESTLPHMCRICRADEDPPGQTPQRNAERLIRCPCLCKGSVGYVHGRCLARWRRQRHGAKSCEICHAPYNFGRAGSAAGADPDQPLPPLTAAEQLIFDQREQLQRRQRWRRLFRPYCMGRIVKCALNFAALSLLTWHNAAQLQQFVEEAAQKYAEEVARATSAAAAAGAAAGTATPSIGPGPPGVAGVIADLPIDGEPPVVLMALYLMGVGVVYCSYLEWTVHAVQKCFAVLEHWWWWSAPSASWLTMVARHGAQSDVAAAMDAMDEEEDEEDGMEMRFGSEEDMLGWTFLTDVN